MVVVGGGGGGFGGTRGSGWATLFGVLCRRDVSYGVLVLFGSVK